MYLKFDMKLFIFLVYCVDERLHGNSISLELLGWGCHDVRIIVFLLLQIAVSIFADLRSSSAMPVLVSCTSTVKVWTLPEDSGENATKEFDPGHGRISAVAWNHTGLLYFCPLRAHP